MARRKAQQQEEENVTDTVTRLGIDSLDEETEGETVNPLEAEDDEEEQEPPQTSAPLPAPPSPFRTALFEQELPPPSVARPSPSLLLPEMPVVEPPTRTARRQKSEAAPGMKRMGGNLAKKLPGAERVRIEKRGDGEKLELINEYRAADLANFTDVESFVLTKLKPKYGHGSYKITGIDAAGNRIEAGEITIAPDPSATATTDQGVIGLVQQLLDQQKREAQMPDPVSMMKGLLEVQQTMAAGNQGKSDDGGSLLAAVISSQGQQMQAMMQAMSQQANQTLQAITAVMAQPKEDPLLKQLLLKLTEERSSSSSLAALPPPPPPPPPTDWVAVIAAFTPLVTTLLKRTESSSPETNDLLRQLIAAKDQDRMTPRDMIQLMQDVQQSRGTDDFRKSAENMTMMLNLMNAFRGQNEGSSSAGFFDALAALFSNKDFGASIAANIRAKADEKARLEQRQMLMHQQAQLRAQQPVAVVRPNPPQQAEGQVIPLRPQQTPAAVAQAPAPAPTAQQPQAASAPQKLQQLPAVPPQTYEHINLLASAKDPAELIQHTVMMLVYFAQSPDWRPVVEHLLTAVQQGQKESAVELMHALFSHFLQQKLITKDLGNAVVIAFVQNFEEVRAGLSGLSVPSSGFEILDEGLEEEDDGGEEDEESDEEDEEEDLAEDGTA